MLIYKKGSYSKGECPRNLYQDPWHSSAGYSLHSLLPATSPPSSSANVRVRNHEVSTEKVSEIQNGVFCQSGGWLGMGTASDGLVWCSHIDIELQRPGEQVVWDE